MCGVTAAIAVVDGKWKSGLIRLLESGPRRPGELRRELPGLSEKVLTQALREMEADGLVRREVHDVRPLKTTYSLTEDEARTTATPRHLLRLGPAPPGETHRTPVGLLRHHTFPPALRSSGRAPLPTTPQPGSSGRRPLPSTHKKVATGKPSLGRYRAAA
ncbi:hypothetical protein SCYAM73S_06566 [Streptomyces cyaneofuscatus]